MLFPNKTKINKNIVDNFLVSAEVYKQWVFLDKVIYSKIKKEDNARKDFEDFSLNYIQNKYPKFEDQVVQKNYLFNFLDHSNSESFLQWYIKDIFIFNMLQDCINALEYVGIFCLRYFITNLSSELDREENKIHEDYLYIGTGVSQEDYNIVCSLKVTILLNRFVQASSILNSVTDNIIRKNTIVPIIIHIKLNNSFSPLFGVFQKITLFVIKTLFFQ
jgi:hypothetical protein